jgi:hypothetical protein
MTRSGLKTAIMAWLHRASFRTPVADPFDAADGFIAICEQDLNEKLRARCMVIRTKQQVDAQYTTLPCDLLEPFDFRIEGGPPLMYASRDQMATALYTRLVNDGNQVTANFPSLVDYMPIVQPPGWPWGNGCPRRFSIVGAEIEWSPFPVLPPDQPPGQPIQWPIAEMAYYQRLGLGWNDTDTNSVLSMYPACYLFGSLIQSAPFLRDDSRVKLWSDLYNNAIEGANREHQRSRTQGSRLVQTYRRLA